MLEASLISAQLTDLRISEGDQYLLYLRNLPEKVQEFAQLHCAATTVTKLWEAVNSYYVRMRMTGDLDKVHVAQGKPAAATGSDVVCHNCGRKGHIARECPNPPKCSHCGKSGHLAKDCWSKDPSKRPEWNTKGKTKGNCQACCCSQRERKRRPRQSQRTWQR